MFRKIAVTLGVVIVAFLVYAAGQPNTFSLLRMTTIQAPATKIFPLISDFHQWTAWSPFEAMDPTIQRTYSGATSGKGAGYAWEGKKIGQGSMTITEATAPSKIVINLDFTKPMQAQNIVEFTLEAKGNSTDVTWTMHGPNPYIAKVIHLFISMDKMVGKDFSNGLAKLKALAEK